MLLRLGRQAERIGFEIKHNAAVEEKQTTRYQNRIRGQHAHRRTHLPPTIPTAAAAAARPLAAELVGLTAAAVVSVPAAATASAPAAVRFSLCVLLRLLGFRFVPRCFPLLPPPLLLRLGSNVLSKYFIYFLLEKGAPQGHVNVVKGILQAVVRVRHVYPTQALLNRLSRQRGVCHQHKSQA